MRACTILSTSQWAGLEALFEQALANDAQGCRELVERIRADDPVLATSLVAMLAAHEHWQDHTNEARRDWRQQVRDGALLASGEEIGPYRIRGLLGEGGMGVVYLAERIDGEVALTAAIKVLRPGILDVAARERFQRERDLLAGLNHPHIARLFDAGMSAGGQPYFVMEYIRGTTIVRHCDTARLDIQARLRLFLHVCDAVRYAHNQLVLHRDIKPNNVLVDEAGVAKLIDFGIAKPLAFDGEFATATAQRFFSPVNVAPEQLRGERVGVACDVYQLGTVLYELLCGESLFDLAGRTPGEVEEAIRQQLPAAPSVRVKRGGTAVAQARACADTLALVRRLSGDLDEIVLMALRKEPERRYASVEQLMDDIGRHLDIRPVRARGSDRGYRIARFFKRRWRVVGLATAALFAVIVFVATLGHQSRQLQNERDHAVLEQHRAEEAIAFLVGVFKAADPKVSMSRTTPVGQVLENGRRRIDSELSDQPQLQADLFFAIAEIYSDLDALADAENYSKKSLALRESLLPDSQSMAQSLDQLTRIHANAGDCADTTTVGRRALDLYRKLGAGAVKTRDVQSEIIICEAHEKGDEYGRDRLVLLLQELQRDPDATPPLLARHEQLVADFLTNLGDIEGAARLYRSAAARLDQGVWRDSAAALSARQTLANVFSQAKKYDEAVAAFNTLVSDYARVFGKDSASYAGILMNRGANYFDMKRYTDTEADFLESKRIYDAIRPDPHPDRAAVAVNLAALYQHGLKDPSRAGHYYEEAVRVALAVWGPHDRKSQAFRADKALWLEEAGRANEAEPELEALSHEISTDRVEGVEVRLVLAELKLQSAQRAQGRALIAECEAAIAATPAFAPLANQVASIRKKYPQ